VAPRLYKKTAPFDGAVFLFENNCAIVRIKIVFPRLRLDWGNKET